ncbi:lysophospholipid acyltransferase family protein [Tepidicella xavieri]|jgi:1-acyl-sn-glycerol-3-phosphate acyltransferase|uniref:1-acyl-sn-glycerol-3-phosphate acyltransferase n=1 Tax=Tepidicella xavieri TaxID=360241 RepID=A0A4R6U5K6_9BURK|nr:lysophospholipid acyltransferase family protein [Tepidicella xavieri]TDQ41760.1 1-acyl-sn-glycerol-3-phosphate acyltransferase [Tepidicella xavieri]
MNLLRSWLHLLFMGVTLVPWALTALVASLFMRGERLYWLCVGWVRLVVWAAGWMLGIRNRVIGYENLPTGTRAPAILLAKHQSTWETFCLPVLMPHPLAFVFKKELLYVPLFGWALGRLDMIHIDRAKRAQAFAKVVQQGQRLLDQGTWVIMFPEGTRIPRGQQGTYKTGGARLAVQTGVPVIPIAITSGKCWPRRAIVKRPGVVEFSIGKPIPSAGRDPDELMQEVEAWIEAEMRRLDPQAYADHPATRA